MKSINIIPVSILIAFAFLGCKSGNDVSTAQQQHESKSETATASAASEAPQGTNARLVVSFISIGEGADFKAKDSMDVYISRYQAENKKELKYESVPWGREGEMDYCFSLSELNSKEQAQFIKGIKEMLKFSELVQITENQPCKQRR